MTFTTNKLLTTNPISQILNFHGSFFVVFSWRESEIRATFLFSVVLVAPSGDVPLQIDTSYLFHQGTLITHFNRSSLSDSVGAPLATKLIQCTKR